MGMKIVCDALMVGALGVNCNAQNCNGGLRLTNPSEILWVTFGRKENGMKHLSLSLSVKKTLLFLIMISLYLFVLACEPKLRKPAGEMDTPEHHVYSGLRLLAENNYGQARREFELAL